MDNSQKSSSKSIPIKKIRNKINDESQNSKLNNKNKDSQKELLKLEINNNNKNKKRKHSISNKKHNQEPPIKKKNKLRTSYTRRKIKNTEENKKDINSENLKMSHDELIPKNNKNINININNFSNNSSSKIFKLRNSNIDVFKFSKFAEKNMVNDNIIFKNLTARELNELEYKTAIEIDKRTYLQYYCSLIKRNELILFTFMNNDDYNLFTLKLCLFLISFSLFMIVDSFFFSKDKMHEIYVKNGAYDLLMQIPQILYSAIISTIIITLLKLLSLTENGILSIKKEQNLKNCYKMAKGAKRYIIMKTIIFIFISLIFIVLFWYYLSCFCAVYVNTQTILIKDSILSFCLSMIYPFGLCLLPGIFRITALRAKNHDKEGLYKFSYFISLI